MKKFGRRLARILGVIMILWILLTIWAESEGKKRIVQMGDNKGATALILYDPDPFYNLDQQLCEAFGKVLADSGWNVTVATVAAAKKIDYSGFHLYVLCANTYNWAPDWAITRFIKSRLDLANKKVVAITLGGGSTTLSQKKFERIIRNRQALIVSSKTYWLWRPNDESQTKESNVKVAIGNMKKWAAGLISAVK